MTIFSSIVICMYIYISLISYTPEYIIIKDGKKMVADVEGFHHTYANIFFLSFEPLGISLLINV